MSWLLLLLTIPVVWVWWAVFRINYLAIKYKDGAE